MPAKGLLRRLKLWSLTDGFIVLTPQQLSVEKFYSDLEASGDEVLATMTKIDITSVNDWNELMDVLRSSEQLYEAPLGDEDVCFELLVTANTPGEPRQATVNLSVSSTLESLATEVRHLHHSCLIACGAMLVIFHLDFF